MKNKSTLAWFVCLITTLVFADETSRFVSTVNAVSNEVPAGYVPPLVSNGSLCTLVDYLGEQSQNTYVKMTPTVFREGRRYGPPKDKLIPFGHFETDVAVDGNRMSVPARWSQTLDVRSAIVRCSNTYENGLVVETEVFCPFSSDIILIRKRVLSSRPAVSAARLTFRYHFTPPGKENKPPRRVSCDSAWVESRKRADFHFQADAHQPCEGLVSVFADQPVEASVDGQIAELSADLSLADGKAAEVTFCLSFEDSLNGNKYAERLRKIQDRVLRQGFDGVFTDHQKTWEEYWDASYVRLPDARLERVYNTAQYHLRVNATEWSFPVGIFNSHWAGRFFGWDEMFCYQALISSNHRDIARRGPEFRRAGLRKAIRRVSHGGRPGKYGARYPWQTMEDGTEGGSVGYWMEHVFHMSNIALASWYHFLYTDDMAYLKKTAYPVMKECARFYLSHMVYDWPDGGKVIGKCTDLERLGPAKFNPFMTSCGVIYTMETAAKAAALLQVDDAEAVVWKETAAKLRESLPEKDGRFVPYAGCPDESVATLGGLFPYPVFDETEPRQRKAVYHYLKHGRAFGNMYSVGHSVCAWYLGWMAAALADLGDTREPARMLSEAAGGAGCFNELFEINEKTVRRVPWFSTASGNVVYALNKMLLQNRGSRILLARGVPAEWHDYSFKLACHGDMVVEAKVVDGRLQQLTLLPGDSSNEQRRTVVLPAELAEKLVFNTAAVRSVSHQQNNVQLDVSVKGRTEVVALP
ncbi:MAG: hypothetical protein R6V06_06095 [Kiritimatiellia bacterium]